MLGCHYQFVFVAREGIAIFSGLGVDQEAEDGGDFLEGFEVVSRGSGGGVGFVRGYNGWFVVGFILWCMSFNEEIHKVHYFPCDCMSHGQPVRIVEDF